MPRSEECFGLLVTLHAAPLIGPALMVLDDISGRCRILRCYLPNLRDSNQDAGHRNQTKYLDATILAESKPERRIGPL